MSRINSETAEKLFSYTTLMVPPGLNTIGVAVRLVPVPVCRLCWLRLRGAGRVLGAGPRRIRSTGPSDPTERGSGAHRPCRPPRRKRVWMESVLRSSPQECRDSLRAPRGPQRCQCAIRCPDRSDIARTFFLPPPRRRRPPRSIASRSGATPRRMIPRKDCGEDDPALPAVPRARGRSVRRDGKHVPKGLCKLS